MDRRPKERPDPDELRRRYLALACNAQALARELGIGRSTLYRWFDEAGLDRAALRESLDTS